LDNHSTQGDLEWLAESFPQVQGIKAPKNDYLYSYNWYAAQSTARRLVLLNNDLLLRPGFLRPLLDHLDTDDVFAVSATSRDWNDTEFTFGPISLKAHHGSYYWNPDFARQETSHTLFACGGFMAVDRLKFLALGGFHPLYHPIYCEDLDICFRGWRRGWRTLFEPRSVTLHREHASVGGEEGGRAARLTRRAKYLFQWSSLPPACPWPERVAYETLQTLSDLAAGRTWRWKTRRETAAEWRKHKRRYADMKTTSEELEQINQRIEEKL